MQSASRYSNAERICTDNCVENSVHPLFQRECRSVSPRACSLSLGTQNAERIRTDNCVENSVHPLFQRECRSVSPRACSLRLGTQNAERICTDNCVDNSVHPLFQKKGRSVSPSACSLPLGIQMPTEPVQTTWRALYKRICCGELLRTYSNNLNASRVCADVCVGKSVSANLPHEKMTYACASINKLRWAVENTGPAFSNL